jgi:hypothetical protein
MDGWMDGWVAGWMDGWLNARRFAAEIHDLLKRLQAVQLQRRY